MSTERDFEQKRKAKQFFMGLVFIVVLVLGWYFPLLGFFIPLCMLLGIGIGISGRGRKWCDWYCPRGSFYDSLIIRLSPRKTIPPILRNMYFRLGVLTLLMLILAVNLIIRWPHYGRIGAFFVTLLTVTTTLGIILALIFHHRSWCMICPIGTIINLAAKNKNPLMLDSDFCVECKLCVKGCPMQIKPYLFKATGAQAVKDKDCLSCGSCVSRCPRGALRFKS